MYATLGNIVFETLNGFTSFTSKEETNYAEFAKMQSAPSLQAVSEKAQEVNIGMLLRQEFVNVQQALTNLRTARKAATVLPLTWGNGRLEGYFVLTTLDVAYNAQYADGTPYDVTVTATLKQYSADSLATQQNQTNINRALAVGNSTPVAVRPPVPPTPVSIANTQIHVLNGGAIQMQTDLPKANTREQSKAAVKKMARQMQQATLTLRNLQNTATNAVNNIQAIASGTLALDGILNSLLNDLAVNGTITNAPLVGTQINDSVRQLNQLNTPNFITQITRR